MSWLPFLGAGLLGWVLVVLTTPWLLKQRWLNRPRVPDLHHTGRIAVPRLGGLSIVLAYVGILVFINALKPEASGSDRRSFMVTLAPLAMFALGFWDDLKPLGARPKLLSQVLIALVISSSGMVIHCRGIPGWSGLVSPELCEVVLTTAWLVTFTNAMNLVDGVDGLAGSLGLVQLALLMCLSGKSGLPLCQWIGLTGALMGFLRFNKPAARVFLGDGGAYFLGFQFGLASVEISQAAPSQAPLFLAVLGLAVPIFDMGLAVARRGLKGLPLLRPDRNHLHHKLLEAGMSPSRVVLCYTGFTLVCVLAGVLAPVWVQADRTRAALLIGLAVGISTWGLFRGWRALRCQCSGSLAMRPEISYALCLRTWLRHEAERCASVEELFADLKWAARRLGFTSVRLVLADGFRIWAQPSVCGPLLSTRHPLQGGALGVLELKAPQCRFSAGRFSPGPEHAGPCRPVCRPLLKDSALIKVLSELLAESWVEATRDWGRSRGRLRFDQRLPRGQERRGLSGAELTGSEPTPKIEGPKTDFLASRMAAALKRACGLALVVFFLGPPASDGAETIAPSVAKASLLQVPRVELPAKVASLITGVAPARRPELTRSLLAETGTISPTLLPVVVGAISKSLPEIAALAAGVAAAQRPELAQAVAQAAAVAAPGQTHEILLAVCRAVPGGYQEVALCLERVVPGAAKQLRDTLPALASGAPEIQATNRFVQTGRSSAVDHLKAPNASVSPALVRTGPPRRPGSPLVRGPRVGPPFVPLSGTLSNVTSSTSGTVPTGGRNYATP